MSDDQPKKDEGYYMHVTYYPDECQLYGPFQTSAEVIALSRIEIGMPNYTSLTAGQGREWVTNKCNKHE